MAKVPDLGSDFAQKLLLDLRRRRERLGFGSAAAAQQQQQQQRTASSAAAATRDARSSSPKQLRSQKPQQAAPAPRARTAEAKAAPRSSHQQQPSNAIATAGKPRRRRGVAPVAADAQAIVPYQGGGGGDPGAGNGDVQQMAALALALSDSGKLRNVEIMARNGSVFLRGPDTPAQHRGGAGGVAIGVQDLNDMFMSAYSSGGGRRRSDQAGKKLFRGSMDMEEALSMLVMLQDASGYMEGSGSGKVMLLKGKENRESSTTTTTSARIVEIVDEEDSETERAKDASMQIVVHDKFVQSNHSADSSSVMQSVPSDSKINNASDGGKDGSKVRMPSVIAKLMGLESLPSSAAKTAVERKGTERFVKPESVPRMEIRANTIDRKLPIRIVASEKVLSNGHHNILLPGEWKSNLTNFGESELSGTSHSAIGNKHVRLTMREMLRKMVGAERGADGGQGVDEKIIHEDKAFTEEIKLQKTVSVGCRNDSGKKMDFLKRFRKNSDSRPAMEDKHIAQEKSASVGKKQATGMKRLLGRDGEAKSRRAREKLNKENQATAETKAAASGKNVKADQTKRHAQSKHMDRQTTARKARNCRETQSETPSRNLKDKKSVISEVAHMKKKPEYTVVIRREDEEHAKVNDISFSKLSDGDGGVSEELAMRDSSTTGAASSDQTSQKITEGASDPTIPVQTVVHAGEDLKFLDQIATSEVHVRDRSRTGAASSDQTSLKITEGASDPTISATTVVHGSEDLKFLDQIATSEVHVRDRSRTGAASSDQTSQKITEGASHPIIPVTTVVHAGEDSEFLDQIATSEVHVRDSSRTGAASSDQTSQKITEGSSDPTIPVQASEELKFLDHTATSPDKALQEVTEGASDPALPVQAVVHASEDLKFLDQSATSETHDGRINHTNTETTLISETLEEDEQQQTQHLHQQQMIAREQPTDGPDHTTTSTDSTGSQDHATHVVSCDSFTENQLLLARLLVKDRYLLETAKTIVRVHDPISFIDDDDVGGRNRPDKGSYDLLSDVARDVIRRKGKRSEALEDVSVACTVNVKLRYLDDLVRELDGDVESLDMFRRSGLESGNGHGTAEGLQVILQSDIQNHHPDANSTWDFGWNRVSELPIEKNEVVRDLEKNILGGIITDVARDLIGVSVRLGCCACVA